MFGNLLMDFIEPFLSVFVLVFLAEFGDKSQLVCMSLSTRYSSFTVLLGSSLALTLLNLIAVLFGGVINSYLPLEIVLAVVSGLFIAFGIMSLRSEAEDEQMELTVGKRVVLSIFMLIFLAELGDKTQLSVVGMAAVENIWIVFAAGTSALLLTTVLGIWLGKVVLKKIPVRWVHLSAGLLFLLFGLVALSKLFNLLF